MKIINAGYEILTPINREEILKSIEIAGRTCYKSEDKITEDSASKFVKMLINRGHEAMIEHAVSISIKFICDRGVSHEIVRHRLFSFAQESTRYCNYGGKDIVFILPCWFNKNIASEIVNHPSLYVEDDSCPYPRITSGAEYRWVMAMLDAERHYQTLVKRYKWSPQEARTVLPNSLKTEIIVSGNVREWRHFFKLRTAKVAHPQMQEITRPLLIELQEKLPELFGDIEVDK